ncbi:MAG: hypothetical protein KGM42_06970 [Hyphomicrobiales bacterium]|nr:hypothetical protein [Hyphomicrobiales bacterium]
MPAGEHGAFFAGGRRYAACLTLGVAEPLTAAAVACAWALNPDPGTNAAAMGLWCAYAALGGLVLASARRPRLQAPCFAAGLAVCAAVAAFELYLVVGFRIF